MSSLYIFFSIICKIPVRAVQLQQQKSAGQLPAAAEVSRQLPTAGDSDRQRTALTRQLSGASAVTNVSATTTGSTAATGGGGHLSGYDTSTTHRFDSNISAIGASNAERSYSF